MQAIDPAAPSRFLDNVIPMHGRMIHDLNGDLESQPYDRNGQVGYIFNSFSFDGNLLVFTSLYRICPTP